jgi:hypothetical protein
VENAWRRIDGVVITRNPLPESRRHREENMRRRYIYSVMLAAVLVLPMRVSAYRLKESWQRTFEVGPDCMLILENKIGSIDVESWGKNEVEVYAEIRIKAPSKSKAQKLFKRMEFDVGESPRRIRIKADLPRIRQDTFFGLLKGQGTSIAITYHVKVPRATRLDLETVNGDIDVDEVEGVFEVKTVNGSVDYYSPAGEGVIHSVNGSIECRIDDFPKAGELKLETVNGGIELGLPEDVGGELEARTSNGRVRVKMELQRKIKVKRSTIKGILGDGEGKIFVKTVNGGITLKPIRVPAI